MRRDRRADDVVRITGARSSLTEDVRGRQRRYVLSMVVRTVCVILTVVLWHVNMWIAWATLAVGLLLPYVAVVIANGGRENAKDLPSAFVNQSTAPMLESHPKSFAAPDGDRTSEPGGNERSDPRA